jgi:mannose-1-phosphate guanylyltransferase
MEERFVVIMAGGKGERFWPQSRLRRPKHLLPIVGDSPMLRQTIDRLPGLVPVDNIFIITNQEQQEAVSEVCPQVPPENVVAEPVGRDTAAAVGLAALLVKRRNPKASFAMLPADHAIRDEEHFRQTLAAAFEAAESDDVLVTVAIAPTEPATGYGYIQKGERWKTLSGREFFKAKRFVEKPNLETAQGYLDSGDYFWNAGMFVWTVAAINREIALREPELSAGLGRIEQALAKGDSLNAALNAHYPSLQKISIDYAVMEKSDRVVTAPADFDWDDVGEWPALSRHFPCDERGNVSRGSVILEGGSGNVAISTADHLVALIGCDDLIVVHTADATLVCRKEDAQNVKKLVKRLEEDSKFKRLL